VLIGSDFDSGAQPEIAIAQARAQTIESLDGGGGDRLKPPAPGHRRLIGAKAVVELSRIAVVTPRSHQGYG